MDEKDDLENTSPVNTNEKSHASGCFQGSDRMFYKLDLKMVIGKKKATIEP